MDFLKNSPGHGKVMEFQFLVPKYHAVWKLGKFSLSPSKNMPQKGWVFSISELWKIFKSGHEKVMEKSLNFISQFLREPCLKIWRDHCCMLKLMCSHRHQDEDCLKPNLTLVRVDSELALHAFFIRTSKILNEPRCTIWASVMSFQPHVTERPLLKKCLSQVINEVSSRVSSQTTVLIQNDRKRFSTNGAKIVFSVLTLTTTHARGDIAQLNTAIHMEKCCMAKSLKT